MVTPLLLSLLPPLHALLLLPPLPSSPPSLAVLSSLLCRWLLALLTTATEDRARTETGLRDEDTQRGDNVHSGSQCGDDFNMAGRYYDNYR